jgi:hypothetical protein
MTAWLERKDFLQESVTLKNLRFLAGSSSHQAGSSHHTIQMEVPESFELANRAPDPDGQPARGAAPGTLIVAAPFTHVAGASAGAAAVTASPSAKDNLF